MMDQKCMLDQKKLFMALPDAIIQKALSYKIEAEFLFELT